MPILAGSIMFHPNSCFGSGHVTSHQPTGHQELIMLSHLIAVFGTDETKVLPQDGSPSVATGNPRTKWGEGRPALPGLSTGGYRKGCPKCHEESSPQGFVLPFSLWGQDMSLHVFQCVPFFLQHPWGQEIPIIPGELSIGSNSYHCDWGFGCWLISPYFHPCLMGPKPFKNTKTTWVIYRIDNRRCHLVGAETARIGWLIRLTTDMLCSYLYKQGTLVEEWAASRALNIWSKSWDENGHASPARKSSKKNSRNCQWFMFQTFPDPAENSISQKTGRGLSLVGSKFTISPIRVSQGEEARNSDRVEQDLYNLYHIMFISDHLCLSAYVCINIYIIYIQQMSYQGL